MKKKYKFKYNSFCIKNHAKHEYLKYIYCGSLKIRFPIKISIPRYNNVYLSFANKTYINHHGGCVFKYVFL